MSDSPDVDKTQVYEEVGRNYRVFLHWREKIVGGYLTIVGVLGLGFYQSAGHCGFRFVLLSAAIVVSFAFLILNVRNSTFIRKCVEAGRALESTKDAGFYTRCDLRSDVLTHGLAFSLLQSTVIAASSFGIVRDWSCSYESGHLYLIIGGLVIFLVLNCNHFKAMYKRLTRAEKT